MIVERRRCPRGYHPLDELVGLLHLAAVGQLPRGLWTRLTATENVTLSNALYERRRNQL